MAKTTKKPPRSLTWWAIWCDTCAAVLGSPFARRKDALATLRARGPARGRHPMRTVKLVPEAWS
jgi:hypothetical protein